MYKNHPLNLDVTDIFELVTKVAQKRNHHVPHETSELVVGKALTHCSSIKFFIIINMDVQTSLREPRLIPWVLKLTTM
jgi:hypothetical protein